MSVANITIADQKIGLKFGMPAIRRIMEKMQQYELVSAGKSNDLGISHILFAGYLNYCLMRDEAPVLDFQPFYEYVESAADLENTRNELILAVKAFEESRAVKSIVDKKKKATEEMETSIGTTSNPSATGILVIPPPTIAG